MMKRRDFAAALFVSMAGGCAKAASGAEETSMTDVAPEKIRLVPDDWRIQHAGNLADGRLFWIDAQLNYANGHTKDFVCTFVFAADGSLSEHEIELIGVRGEYPGEAVALAIERHVVALGGHVQAAIWVRPFSSFTVCAACRSIAARRDGGESTPRRHVVPASPDAGSH